MKLIKKILNRFSGYEYPQEYLCLENDRIPEALHVYLVKDGQVIQDVSSLHLFVGYKPLIFAFPKLERIDLNETRELSLVLSNRIVATGSTISLDQVVARLTLIQVEVKEINRSMIYFYEGSDGNHKFLSPVNQWAIQLENEWFNKKPGNVFLSANLYRQVQIAYAIPRRISLITLRKDEAFNVFPTDLHGRLNEDIYLISLRHAGLAAQQVELTKKIVLSQLAPSAYKLAYGLGKNHMQPPKAKEHFPFLHNASEKFGIPVPDQATGYFELTLEDSSVMGIHRLFVFSISADKTNSEANSLVHIHNAYASWRKKNGLSGNYLLR